VLKRMSFPDQKISISSYCAPKYFSSRNRVVVINVNTKFQSKESIGGKISRPVANETFEKESLDFLDPQLMVI